MWIPLLVLSALLSGALGAWAAVRAARDQPVIWRQLKAGAVVEGVLVLEAAVAVVMALGTSRPHDAPTFWGYLVTTLLILPVAAAWSFAERTRWSSVVLLVAALTVAFLQLRLWQVWQA
ncbi:hypothetical protein Q6348_12320 [Isoptericola sp. b441]|uniref:Integral membrane protein n=1 Tax=Actinotalea lenta TaxID=3064654 RepID=A0ABT9DEK4_9CELL|nr:MULTISPECIES: hypothetical protein [unclassified Isoptericola]MDO8107981.1 hypothetical protein [Isoptericola sp. b441]MDO8120352.1 hypothetical protein [Isoptericola sp. b490]